MNRNIRDFTYHEEITYIFECRNLRCDNNVMNPKGRGLGIVKMDDFLKESEYPICEHCGKRMTLAKEKRNTIAIKKP